MLMPQTQIIPFTSGQVRRYNQLQNRFIGNESDIMRLRSGRRISTRQRQKSARSYTQTRRRQRRRGTAGQGVTEQFDRKLIYARKRMPSKFRKRWKRFKNKVNAVAEKELGSQTVVFNRQWDYSNSTTGKHAYGSFYLYGGQSAEIFANDLNYISNIGNAGAPSVANGVTIWPSTKYLFLSGVLDITIQNRSFSVATVSPSVTYSYGAECKLELDIYELTVPVASTTSGGNFDTITAMLDSSIAVQNTIKDNNAGGSTNGTSIANRGCTPWDLSYALSRFHIKINKKTKFMLNQSETVTYQYRDPKRHSIQTKEMNTLSGFNRPGMTRILLVIGKLVPGAGPLGAPTVVGNYTERFSVGVTRKYLYKVDGQTDDRSLYINN